MTASLTRRRPVFSIRTLLIVMTLLCAYAACWWPTKEQGVQDVVADADLFFGGVAIAPLVVACGDMEAVGPNPNTADSFSSVEFRPVRRYYFWFFGYVAKLPYEHELSDFPALEEYEDGGQTLPSPAFRLESR